MAASSLRRSNANDGGCPTAAPLRCAAACGAAAAAIGLGACRGALAPAGDDAERIALLFWIMAVAAAVLWLAVAAVAIYARYRRCPPRRRVAMWLIIIGGAVVPVVATSALLAGSLPLLPRLLETHDGLQVRVEAERWWWRVTYTRDGQRIETANELRLPENEPATLLLSSRDVIHSLWIPELGGKLDMIPGRTTRLDLRPLRSGVYAGICAEYCGSGHARMRFDAVVMPRAGFDAWLAQQAGPRKSSPQGAGAFFKRGCGGCHRVRGTPADGRIGPDLTHLGMRRTLGAGTLALTPKNLARWIARPQHFKPGALMPAYDMLHAVERRAIATWLLEAG